MMRPTGTVTFLMNHIEGSTRLVCSLGGERYEAALDLHRLLLRGAFHRFASSGNVCREFEHAIALALGAESSLALPTSLG